MLRRSDGLRILYILCVGPRKICRVHARNNYLQSRPRIRSQVREGGLTEISSLPFSSFRRRRIVQVPNLYERSGILPTVVITRDIKEEILNGD